MRVSRPLFSIQLSLGGTRRASMCLTNAISQKHPCGFTGMSVCFVVHGPECVYCMSVLQSYHTYNEINKRTQTSFKWVLYSHTESEDKNKEPKELLTPPDTHTHPPTCQQRPSVRFCLLSRIGDVSFSHH